MNATNLIIAVCSCLLLIGFFASIEIAFLSVNKINIELRKKSGSLSGRILGHFADAPYTFVGTSLIGINLVLVVYGTVVTQLNEKWMQFLVPSLLTQNGFVKLALDTIIATLIILLFAELLPKAIFKKKAEPILSIMAVPMWGFYKLFYPVASVFINVSKFILKYLFNVRIKDRDDIFSRVDIDQFVRQSLHGHEGEHNTINSVLFENAVDLVNVKVRKCLIPRNEIIGIDKNADIEELSKLFITSRRSKIIVYDKTMDQILGYVHHLDMLKQPKDIGSMMHSIYAVPETMSAVMMMNSFTKERKSVAWVIDEFGGTAGIVTMEDVLEEIFGEINDEYDSVAFVENQIAENEYIFSGRLELDYLNNKYDFELDKANAETLSGLIINSYEAIPKIRERIIVDHYEFEILLVSETRIETVKMKILK
jgi:CBS domain containing-hemolysin-like protein